MAPSKPTKNRRGQANLHDVQKGHPKKRPAHGRTKGAKNKNPARTSTDEELKFAVNMDTDRREIPTEGVDIDNRTERGTQVDQVAMTDKQTNTDLKHVTRDTLIVTY